VEGVLEEVAQEAEKEREAIRAVVEKGKASRLLHDVQLERPTAPPFVMGIMISVFAAENPIATLHMSVEYASRTTRFMPAQATEDNVHPLRSRRRREKGLSSYRILQYARIQIQERSIQQ
jgi:hypothetical protein